MVDSDERLAFGPLLRRLRLSKGLSQEALAERARMSTEAIGALERGNRTSPRRQTVSLLVDGLELEPSERLQLETAAIKRSLPRRRWNGEPTMSDTAVRAAEDVPNNLPAQMTSLIGRENELVAIEKLIAGHRLVTLVGTGGVGKTRCAVQAGTELRQWSGGVWLTDLAPVSDSSLVTNAVAHALNIHESPQRPILEVLVGYLKRKRLLIILDNCEHVIDAVRELVSAVLPECPELHILATSRESLNVSGEEIYQIPPLTVPTHDSPSAAVATQYGAVQLFVEHALAIDKQFVFNDETAPTVAEICRRLDGIPLAIELAAARVKVLSPAQLAQMLDERLSVLTSGDRSAVPHHRTMRALIDWSYDLLSESERLLFRALSIFVGSFTLDLATALCREDATEYVNVLDGVSSLVDKSLLQTETLSETRYRLLESVRQYAHEKLGATEKVTAARAHAIIFTELAESMEKTSSKTPDPVWSLQAKLEIENWRAALRWTLSEGNHVLLGQHLAAAMRSVWCRLSPAEGQRWISAALDSVDDRSTAHIVARLRLAQAHLALLLTEYQTAAPAAQKALVLFEKVSDKEGMAEAELFAGAALGMQGDSAVGKTLLNRALGAFRARDLDRQTASALQYLALIHLHEGEIATARFQLGEALTIFRRTSGAERSVAHMALVLAEIEYQAGDVQQALSLVSEALALDRARQDDSLVMFDLCNVSAYLVALDRLDEALKSANEALLLASEAGVETGLVVSLQHIAAIAAFRESGAGEDDLRIAARLVGYVDTRMAQSNFRRDYTEIQEYERLLARLRTSFSEAELDMLRTEGSKWSEKLALVAVSRVSMALA